jgi:hypothetical protein
LRPRRQSLAENPPGAGHVRSVLAEMPVRATGEVEGALSAVREGLNAPLPPQDQGPEESARRVIRYLMQPSRMRRPPMAIAADSSWTYPRRVKGTAITRACDI